MPAFNDLVKKAIDTPFMNWDKCSLCGGINGPFVWCRKRVLGQTRIIFVCEDCYNKRKGTG